MQTYCSSWSNFSDIFDSAAYQSVCEIRAVSATVPAGESQIAAWNASRGKGGGNHQSAGE